MFTVLDNRPTVTVAIPPPTCNNDDTGHKDLSDSRPTGEDPESEMVLCSSLQKDDLEQMSPKMRVPMFVSLQPNFIRSFKCTLPDLVGQATLRVPKKSRKAEIYLKQLQEMHHLCLANMSFSQRLLDRKTDTLHWLEGQDILTLPDIDQYKKTKQSKQSTSTVIKQINVRSNPPPSAHELNKKFDEVCTTGQCLKSLKVWDRSEQCSTTPQPLCIEDIYQQKHVQVIGCGLKYWKNFTEISTSDTLNTL